MPPHSQPPRKTISSWKEIAAHFGVTVRSVQLWEEERGMPVHRMPGLKGRVYAYQDELDAWAKRSDGGEEPVAQPAAARPGRPVPWYAAAAILGLAAMGLGWRFWPAMPVPSSWELQGRTLTVKDPRGAAIWTHEFPESPEPFWSARGVNVAWPQTLPLIGDLDGDGKREVLFTYAPSFQNASASELYCFESNGKLRWRFKPGRQVSTRSEVFPPPFFVRMALLAPPEPGKPPALFVVASHSIYYPSQLAAISPQGKVLREYWHSGHINEAGFADLDQDGRPELYLAANHNPSKTTGLIALDPMDFGGASRETNPDYQLQGMGEPNELGRVLLPAAELTRQLPDVTSPQGFRIQDGRIFLAVSQTSPGPPAAEAPLVFYQFGPGLELLGIEYARNYKSFLLDLIRGGRVKPYDLDADLEKLKQIQTITPWRAAAAAASD